MDIKIEERVIGHVTVLDIVGKLTIDEAAGRLKDKINSLVAQRRTTSSPIWRKCRTSIAEGSANWWPPTGRLRRPTAP